MNEPAERDRGRALRHRLRDLRGLARPALVELDVRLVVIAEAGGDHDRGERAERRTRRRSRAARCRPAVRAPARAARSMASPMTPPRPVGSGQCALVGRQDGKARGRNRADAARTTAASIRDRTAGGWRGASPRPRPAAPARSRRGRTIASAGRRRSRRGVPSRLRTGALVAWLSDGSCTDQVASATAIERATARSAQGRRSRQTRRRIRSRRSSDQLDKSMPRSMDAMSSVQKSSSVASPRLAEHGDEAMQRLGGDLLVLHHRDADVALAGIAAVGAVAREIVAGNDAQAAVAPELQGRPPRRRPAGSRRARGRSRRPDAGSRSGCR